MRFSPDQELDPIAHRQEGLAERANLRLLSAGLYFYPGVMTGGDWLHGAVTTHQLDDPRSPAIRDLRRRRLLEAANVGYDRCGHFGLLYCWGNSPNYGDGGFLAPSIDARTCTSTGSSSIAGSLCPDDPGPFAAFCCAPAWLALDDGATDLWWSGLVSPTPS